MRYQTGKADFSPEMLSGCLITMSAYKHLKVYLMTAHINAQPGDFSETVIMPGDPLRAKFSAQWIARHNHSFRKITRLSINMCSHEINLQVFVCAHSNQTPTQHFRTKVRFSCLISQFYYSFLD